jgi:hypothetical protein
MGAAEEDDFIEREDVAADGDVYPYTPLEAEYVERMLDVCEVETGVVSRTIKMLEIVNGLDVDITHARVVLKNEALASEYVALKKFLRDMI